MEEDVQKWIQTLATPVGLPAILLFAVWRIARWLRPRADQVIDGHLSLLISAKTCQEENTKCLQSMEKQAVEQTASLKEQTISLKSIQAISGEQSTILKSLSHHLSMGNNRQS
jgi:hypothetical protein